MFAFARRNPLAGFSSWPPFAKLGLWGAAIVLLSAIVQFVFWRGATTESLLDSSNGRSVVLAISLLTLLYVMAWDRRPMSDYGLVVNGRWGLQVWGGVLLGLIAYGGYYAVATWLGVYHVRGDAVTARKLVNALLACLQALPVALVQQIVVGGYLPSTLRDRHGRVLSILLPSLAFGVMGGLSAGPILEGAGRDLAIGMTLIAALLCVVRLLVGSLTVPVGMLAGAIMVRRALKKLDVLSIDPSSPWQESFAPMADPRQGIAMWIFLGSLLAVASLWLWRRGEAQAPSHQPALDASFKRVLPFSNLLALAPLDLWLRKLHEARWRVGWKYVPRLLVTLVVSTINTLLSLPERWLAPKLLKHAVPDPIFIVGVHRSGTTHLHNLLSFDPQFSAPATYQVFNPHGFLSGIATTALLAPLLTWRRPMDSVQVNIFSPQEEEFALAAMTPHCPYWFGCFPKLFATHERYIYPERMEPAELAEWRDRFTLFLRKLTFWARKRPLLKSPYNTARVAELRRMFPAARFVHIVRDPRAVYRSNMHLAEHGWAVFQLQDPDAHDSYATRFLENYREQEELYRHDAATLPPGAAVEVRFEDIERDPEAVVRRIYAELGLDFSADYAERLQAYVASIADYQKNRFQPLADDDQRRLEAALGPLIAEWGYAPQPAAAAPQDRRRAA